MATYYFNNAFEMIDKMLFGNLNDFRQWGQLMDFAWSDIFRKDEEDRKRRPVNLFAKSHKDFYGKYTEECILAFACYIEEKGLLFPCEMEVKMLKWDYKYIEYKTTFFHCGKALELKEDNYEDEDEE